VRYPDGVLASVVVPVLRSERQALQYLQPCLLEVTGALANTVLELSRVALLVAWEQPLLFFSVDIYTCKAFDVASTVAFTADFLRATNTVARPF
jgi:hypothetical protein